MNVFESIMTGLNEAVEYEKGKLPAQKTTLTIEPLPDISAEEIKVIQSIRDDKRFTKFADLALINVGITTGNNTYFSVDSFSDS